MIIENRHTGKCYYVERLECGEPVITTESGKIRIPIDEYEKHWLDVTKTFWRRLEKSKRYWQNDEEKLT